MIDADIDRSHIHTPFITTIGMEDHPRSINRSRRAPRRLEPKVSRFEQGPLSPDVWTAERCRICILHVILRGGVAVRREEQIVDARVGSDDIRSFNQGPVNLFVGQDLNWITNGSNSVGLKLLEHDWRR